MIFYFSATGNCKWVASLVAEAAGDKVVSIGDCVKNDTYSFDLRNEKTIGFVTPTYDWGLPSIVRDFADNIKLKMKPDTYVFHISTYGTTTGQTCRLLRNRLKKRGIPVTASYSVKMVDVWTPVFDLTDKENNKRITKEAYKEIQHNIVKIKARSRGDFSKNKLPMPLVKAFYLTYDLDNRKTSHFTVDKQLCCGCGLCAKQCQGQAIQMQNGHPVWVKEKCIACLGCLHRCPKFAIQYGKKTHKHGQYTNPNSMDGIFDIPLDETSCVRCGQCIPSTPNHKLIDDKSISAVREAIVDPSKNVVFFTAPSIRTSLGEEFALPSGTNVIKKLPGALRRLGADAAFDMTVAADLTIMEEAYELVDRIKTGKPLPMITSCCPGWVRFAEYHYSNLLPNLSSCKSPQQMFGALLKTYYCEKNGIAPENLFTVSVMPCTAKKEEMNRTEMTGDVNAVLSTRDLAQMLRQSSIDFTQQVGEEFDPPFNVASGAGVIFGATGGVMEAALRTAATILDGDFKLIEFKEVRGTQGIKTATYQVADQKISVAVASGHTNIRTICNEVASGTSPYQFIEIMMCPGGCVNGGGQPLYNISKPKEIRAKVLYDEDAADDLRKSHQSPIMDTLYKEYFDIPNSEKAHHVLHTTYAARTVVKR